MEKITIEYLKEFVAHNTIPYTATQAKLCVPIISRICRKMEHGIKFDDIKICDNLVIDGHHRYLSSLIMNFPLNVVSSNLTSATKATTWDLIEFDIQDWDTPAKIAHLNELDAAYNGLEIKFVSQITFG